MTQRGPSVGFLSLSPLGNQGKAHIPPSGAPKGPREKTKGQEPLPSLCPGQLHTNHLLSQGKTGVAQRARGMPHTLPELALEKCVVGVGTDDPVET